MKPAVIDEAFIVSSANGVGLQLAPGHIAGVAKNFETIAGMAALVNDFTLDEAAETAAIFTPCWPPAQE
jgi:hypothetical protein